MNPYRICDHNHDRSVTIVQYLMRYKHPTSYEIRTISYCILTFMKKTIIMRAMI